VFLMDEPLSNLDAKLRTGTRAQIVELQRRLGTTTLYVTHDQVEAMTMGHRIAVLNGGRLQQLGTPMELYQNPSNLFVAQFIGSPPMNLMPVEVLSGELVSLAGRRISPDARYSPLLGPRIGERLTAGLRPERLRLGPATNRNLPAAVLQVEALGNELLVACQLQEGGQAVQLRADPGAALVPGQTVHLEVDSQGWSFFDAAGEALGQARPTLAPKLELPSFGA
jgi:multiple sugar transport system ATP-binding protein